MRDLWSYPTTRTAEYSVFHDESAPNKRWLLIGLLFVRTLHLDEVRATLSYLRQREDYHGEIHFSALPGSFGEKMVRLVAQLRAQQAEAARLDAAIAANLRELGF